MSDPSGLPPSTRTGQFLSLARMYWGDPSSRLAWVLLVFYGLAASVWTVWLWMTGLRQVPAAQAGVGYDFANGLYVGAWASNGGVLIVGGPPYVGTLPFGDLQLFAGVDGEVVRGQIAEDVGASLPVWAPRGVTITPGTGDKVNLANPSGASATYRVLVLGRTS